MVVDSGPSDLVESTFRELYQGRVLKAIKRRICSYGLSIPLPVLGIIKTEIFANANSTRTTLYIIKGATGNLLVFNTATKLGFLKVLNQVKPDENGPQYPLHRDLENLVEFAKYKRKKSLSFTWTLTSNPSNSCNAEFPSMLEKMSRWS